MIASNDISLFTDFYELTAAQAYWLAGVSDYKAVFHPFFRKCPFGGEYAILAGLEQVLEYFSQIKFSPEHLDWLTTILGSDGKPIFSNNFLDYLEKLSFSCDVQAIPEGYVVFPNEPLMRITGPLIQTQIIETAILTILNFQTLVATKASRLKDAAGSGCIISEFGARRAQGLDGALAASRAAYIGGADGTSNTLAAYLYGIKPVGTMMHSFIMTFDSEMEAFQSYARSMSNNLTFLVDTYDSIQGIEHVVEIAKDLRSNGVSNKINIRLDSGDLAQLSFYAKRRFREENLNIGIVASNDLNEEKIISLRNQEAGIDIYGVGTQLSTAAGYKADNGGSLGGVYKMSSLSKDGVIWTDKIKISRPEKTSIPGRLQVRRYSNSQYFLGDAIYDIGTDINDGCVVCDFSGMDRRKIKPELECEDLLKPVCEYGIRMSDTLGLDSIRRVRDIQISKLSLEHRRFENPTPYKAWLESSLFSKRSKMIMDIKSYGDPPAL